jgi:predicted chitinase
MDAASLTAAMGCSRAVADRYVAAFNAAMIAAGCTTLSRAAMWCAQLGHESAGLRYMEEIASGAAYEGRRDLGNTQLGDGRRYKGRGPIQVTGRSNYAAVSRWAHGHGLVPTPTYFVDNPVALASDRYGFLGPVWYWTVARPTINGLCDKGDIRAVTRLINGGFNGLDDRVRRHKRCIEMGNRILPTRATDTQRPTPAPEPAGPPPQGDEMYLKTPAPEQGTAKRLWPTVRVPFAFEPGTGLLKVDHGGAGGWIHLARWWVRGRGWTANVPVHDPKDHPLGAGGSERFVGFGWVTAPPAGADMIELVLSAPDGVHIQFWRQR